MELWSRLRRKTSFTLHNLRIRLSGPDALVQMAFLGLITGLITGGVIVAFRLCIELLQSGLIQDGGPEHYEGLPLMIRLTLPLAGAVGFWLLYRLMMRPGDQVGVVHVLERLAYHQGNLPLRNAFVQFVGGALAILTGHSVGREGPGVHLGAASASQLGQRLGLPNNSVRTLIACGTAAAIAASFNTPLAGVIFAMEVVMMEYTIFGFAPVLLAGVSAAAVTQTVFGASHVFEVPNLQLTSLLELPYLALMGLILGVLGGIFIRLLELFSRLWQNRPSWRRIALAGLLGSAAATLMPEVMGVGYDTVNSALIGELTLTLALALVVVKTIATTAAVGLGVPGGLIGPLLVIGAAAGTAAGLLGAQLVPTAASPAGFYALIGMVTMMGATLQAPLAAIASMLELTGNPNIILPGMLAVVTGMLVTRKLFGKGPLYLVLMRLRGLDYRNDPISQYLRRVGVASAMKRNVEVVPQRLDRRQAEEIVDKRTRWLLVRREGRAGAILLPAADLARALSEGGLKEGDEIDLAAIPAQRLEAVPTHLRATLQEAYETLANRHCDAVFVEGPAAPGTSRVYGILTRENIESSYR